MKHLSVLFFAACVVVALSWTSQPASAAHDQALSGSSIAQDVRTLNNDKEHKVKPPKDKPKKSKKNPNDGKDHDPDDGDAGGGNDDKKKPGDGPVEP